MWKKVPSLLSLLFLIFSFPVYAGQAITGNLTVSGNTGLGSTAIPNNTLIVSTGNVGIGSVNPTSALCIGSTCQGKISSAGLHTSVGITNTGAAITNDNSYTQSGLSANTYSGTSSFTAAGDSIITTGELGVGITPTQQVHAQRDQNNPTIMRVENDTDDTNASAYVSAKSGALEMTMRMFPSLYSSVPSWAGKGIIRPDADLLFATSTNTIFQNGGLGNQTAILTTAGNLGVGTAGPTAMLAVGTTSQFKVSSVGATTVVGLTNSGAYTQSGSNANTITGTTAFSGATSLTATGNTGLGTTIPNSRLDVAASDSGTTLTSASAATAQIMNTDTTANNFSDVALCTGTSSGGQVACTSKISGVHTAHNNGSSSGDIAFSTLNGGSAGERMRITAPGNVGVGSITPGTKLDVSGTVRMTGFSLPTNPGSGYLLTSNSIGIGTWTPPAAGGGGSGTINSGTTNRLSRYSAATTLDSSVVFFDDATNIGIGTIAPQVRVDISRAIYVPSVAGNIGLGTVVPNSKLDVAGSDSGTTITNVSAAMGQITNTDSTANNFSDLAFCTGTTSGGQIACTSKITGVHTAHNNGSSSGNIAFITLNGGSSGERVRITAPGNVGINSASPGATLDVQGGIRSSGNIGIGGGNTTTNPLQVTGNGAFTGNVGISTTLLNNVLAVKGGVSIGDTYAGVSVTTGNLAVKTNVGIGTYAPQFALAVGSTGGVNISSGGNMGIGTTANQAPLSIMSGNVGIGTYSPVASFQVVGTGNVGIGTVNPGVSLDIFGSAGSARVRVVGIGTTVPQAACIKADGTMGYYTTTTFAGTCL